MTTVDPTALATWNEAGERARKAYRAHVAALNHAAEYAYDCLRCRGGRHNECIGRCGRGRSVYCACDLAQHEEETP